MGNEVTLWNRSIENAFATSNLILFSHIRDFPWNNQATKCITKYQIKYNFICVRPENPFNWISFTICPKIRG